MKKNYFQMSAIALMAVFFYSCEKPVLSEDESDNTENMEKGTGYQVKFQVANFEQIPFETARSVEVKDVCSRISFAVFKMNNDSVVKRNWQKESDANFGTFTLKLPAGKYRIVAIAHNGEGTATISTPEKVTFPTADKKVTDTFCYYQEIEVDGNKTYDMDMKRVVAKVRFVINDPMPRGITEMNFYYTGGSSTLNATTGYGNVNSIQYADFAVTSSMYGKASSFEFYTFPHEENDYLKLQVKAFKGNTIFLNRHWYNIPVSRNQITVYQGNYFSTDDPNKGDDDGGNDKPTPSPDDKGVPFHLTIADTTWITKNVSFELGS